MNSWPKRFADPIYWYFIVIFTALIVGWYWPNNLVFLADYTTLILSGIFFLGALKIEKEDIARIWQLKTTIIVFNLLMLIVLPAAVYFAVQHLWPAYALPLLILASMPTGLATPLLASIVGGRESLAMTMAITTSLLAPFTIPLIIYVLVGVSVEVAVWPMFLSIAEIVFIPFALAWLARKLSGRTFLRIKGGLGRLSTLLLGFLVAGIVARQSAIILAGFDYNNFFQSLGAVAILMASFYLLGFLLYYRQTGQDRLTLTVSFANMNFTLAIFLAHTYFPAPEVVIPVTLAVVPWFVFIVFFKYLTQY